MNYFKNTLLLFIVLVLTNGAFAISLSLNGIAATFTGTTNSSTAPGSVTLNWDCYGRTYLKSPIFATNLQTNSDVLGRPPGPEITSTKTISGGRYLYFENDFGYFDADSTTISGQGFSGNESVSAVGSRTISSLPAGTYTWTLNGSWSGLTITKTVTVTITAGTTTTTTPSSLYTVTALTDGNGQATASLSNSSYTSINSSTNLTTYFSLGTIVNHTRTLTNITSQILLVEITGNGQSEPVYAWSDGAFKNNPKSFISYTAYQTVAPGKSITIETSHWQTEDTIPPTKTLINGDTVTILGAISTAYEYNLTATPNSGYTFVNWTLDSGSGTITNPNSASTTFKIANSNATVTAHFKLAVTSASFDITPKSFTYDGSPKSPTVTASPANATFSTGGTLTATNAGTYTATATATGSFSGSNNNLQWTINKASQSAVSITASANTITAGGSITFTASGGSGTGAYQWTQTATGTGSTKTLSFPTAGTYTIKAYKLGDANYLDSAEASVTVTVNVLTIPTTFIASGSFVYDGTPKTVTITANPATASFATSGTKTATSPGNYSITAVAIAPYTGTATLSWTIAPAPNGSISARAIPASGYQQWLTPSATATAPVKINP